MKNTYLTIARARLEVNADTETLLRRLRSYPECKLVHLFSHEPVILLFIEVVHLHEFPQVEAKLSQEPGIAECHFRHLSPAMQNLFVPTYQPKTWLL